MPWRKPICHQGLSNGYREYLAGEEAGVQIERDPECGTMELESSPGVREPSENVGGRDIPKTNISGVLGRQGNQ